LKDLSAALGGLDKILEHRVRLAICSLLAQSDAINFTRFKALLEQTDGNLGAQLRKLEDAGYIDVDKRFEDRRPVSWYTLTDAGRSALRRHIDALDELTSGL
jgi:DNA-binding PadR family transcriptional regulator